MSSTTAVVASSTKSIPNATKVISSGSTISQLVKPVATARTLVITRTSSSASPNSYSNGGGGGMMEYRQSMTTLPPQFGATSKVMNTGVGVIKTGRQKEKVDLRDLNERLANYIDKVRFLEAQNKKLANELANLRERWGKDTEKIKLQFEVELTQLRNLLNDAEKSKGDLQIRLNTLEDQLIDSQMQLDNAMDASHVDHDTIDKLHQQLADCDGEISLLRRRVTTMDEEKKRDKDEVLRLRNDVNRLRLDLDQATLSHINSENEAHSLRDEMEFLKQVHENQLKELSALAYRDTTQENRDYWKNEMAQALHDIENEYDAKLDAMRAEMDSYYTVKLQEFRTSGTRAAGELGHFKDENIRIKSQLKDLRSRLPELESKNAQLERMLDQLRRENDEQSRENELEKSSLRRDLEQNQTEMDAVLAEMQNLLDVKLSLELEIAAYRKLLEGEETRLGLREMMSKMIRGETIVETQTTIPQPAAAAAVNKLQKSTVTKGEMSAKTTYQRTAKGPVSIQDCSPDGKFLTIENSGKKAEDISGMKVIRNVENGRQIIRYVLPDKIILDPENRKSVKIWAHGQRPTNSTDLEMPSNETTWGVGANIVTTLLNLDGEERATHTQKTIYNQ